MKLRTRFCIFGTLLFLLVFAVTAFMGFVDVKKNVESGIEQYLNSEADMLSEYTNQWLEKKLMAVDTLTKVIEKPKILDSILDGASLHSNKVDFLKPTGYDEDMVHYYFALEDKTLMTGSGWTPKADYNPLTRKWYVAAKEANGPTFTDIFIDNNTKLKSISAVSPMKDKSGKMIGTVTSDLYLTKITDTIGKKAINGGYAFLVDKNGMFLAHPDEELIEKNMEDNEVYKQLFAEMNSGEAKIIDYEDGDIDKIMVYRKIKSTGWSLGVVIERDVAYAPVKDLMKKYLVMMTIGVLVLSILALGIANMAVEPIVHLEKQIDKISKYDISIQHDKKTEKYLKRKDEIGSIAKALNSMQNNFIELIQHIMENSKQVTQASDELSATSNQSAIAADEVARTIEEIARGTNEQSKDTEQGVLQINSLGVAIEKNKDFVEDLNASADKVNDLKDEGLIVLKDLVEKNDVSMKATQDIKDIIVNTNESAEKIVIASQMIESISAQTNLLALNAAIEAARAGEAGKGFAVVAEEIRKLAEQSNEFTAEISKVIQELISKTGTAVTTMDEVGKISTTQTESINNTYSKFTGIADSIDNIKNAIDVINESSHEMEAMKEDIISIIENLSAISEENAASTEEASASVEEQTAAIEEIASSSEDLARLAEEMLKGIMQFKL